jgi:hypothetical protein
VLLVGSLILFALVRVYVRHEGAKTSGPISSIPLLPTASPTGPVRSGLLDLSWDEVPKAVGYQITVASITGQIVVDALPVDGTQWNPPDDALPALSSGEYRWSVEAIDDKGRVLARSSEATFRVTG